MFASGVNSQLHQQSASSAQKLSLVLDLDNTCLHTAERPSDVSLTACADGFDEHHHLLACGAQTLRVALRPGLTEFLSAAARVADIYIYTAGGREYAEAVAALIDPHQRFFRADQLLSRDDETLWGSGGGGKDLRNLLPPERLPHALVVDDRADIWAGQCDHLVQIEPFYAFASQTRVSAGSFTDHDRSSAPLRRISRIIEWVHKECFGPAAAADVDVPRLLARERARHLRRVVIEFDSSVDTDTQLALARKARAHGAVVVPPRDTAKQRRRGTARSTSHPRPTHIIIRRTATARLLRHAHLVREKWLHKRMQYLYPIDESRFTVPSCSRSKVPLTQPLWGERLLRVAPGGERTVA